MSSGAIPYGGTKKHPYNVVVRIFFIGKGNRTRGKTNSLADCLSVRCYSTANAGVIAQTTESIGEDDVNLCMTGEI